MKPGDHLKVSDVGSSCLLVTNNLHQLKTYSKAKTVAAAAPAASFLWTILQLLEN
jgi:hypothetical protein